jgi:RNA recognition motif-containing protein
MARKLYVGNLSWSTTEDTLNTAFRAFGVLKSVRIIMDRETGQSKGFGFVEFDNDADCASAMDKMNGINLDGRPLKVNEATPREPR